MEILNPKVPAGSLAQKGKTAARDTAGAFYVGLVVTVGLAAAAWAVAKGKALVDRTRQSTQTANGSSFGSSLQNLLG